MKLKKDFVLRQVAQAWVVLPLAEETINFSGMLTLNDSGAMLWKILEQGGDQPSLINALVSEYAISPEQASIDVDEFLNKLIQVGCAEAD